jgi:hypothetical protein
MTAIEFRRLRAFERLVRDAIEAAPRDLRGEVARAATLLAIQVEKIHAFGLAAQRYVEIAQKDIPADIDNLSELAALLAGTRDLIGGYHASSLARRQHASDDIVEDYDALLVALASLHNSFNALAWEIGEHDAETDVLAPGSFGSADDLFTAIGV